VENNQRQQYHVDEGSREAMKSPVPQETQEVKEVAPGIPIVRSSTPRPLSFEAMQAISAQALKSQQEGVRQEDPGAAPSFPATAPSAPPLPEEMGEGEEEEAPGSATSTASQSAQAARGLDRAKPAVEEKREFLWLFEYGLEMDSAMLNSPERLGGLALLYGPAVLKGYSVMVGEVGTHAEPGGGGRVIATLVPGSDPESEVWGVLYRIPRRLHEHAGGEPSLLDSAHSAASPQNLFRPVKAIVRETFRDREVTCITYIATDATRQRLRPFSGTQGGSSARFMQQLAAIARKQRLPDRYVSKYAPRSAPVTAIAPAREFVTTKTRVEQNTEPIPIFKEPKTEETPRPVAKKIPALAVPQSPWLVAFAAYLLFVLLVVLIFAVLQGSGFASSLLTTSFAPLGVPWPVLVYGLLGGCMSSIITLARSRPFNPPVFVIITWFARPYIGVVLALFVYLLLTSGLFTVSTTNPGQNALFLLAGALAGLSEGWLFADRR
jgi:cation transport regulator ChaC